MKIIDLIFRHHCRSAGLEKGIGNLPFNDVQIPMIAISCQDYFMIRAASGPLILGM